MIVALIAHDAKKADLVAFVSHRLKFFNRDDVSIITTGTTGKKLKQVGVKQLTSVASGPLGGDAQIASHIVDGNVDAVIFFRDVLKKMPHDVDISMLLRLADLYDTPLATNYATAKLIIKHFSNK